MWKRKLNPKLIFKTEILKIRVKINEIESIQTIVEVNDIKVGLL